MSAPAAWPLWEVTVDPYGSTLLAARSRGAAYYSRYLDYTDAFGVSFRDFLRVASVRRVQSAGSRTDPYAYVRSYYGRDICHGTRVTITGEGADLEGRAGTVVHPGRDSTQYAHVVLDGDRYAIIVHPFSVVVDAGSVEGIAA